MTLAAFTLDEAMGPERRAVLMANQAGWQRSPRLTMPEGIHLAPLATFSPELEPVGAAPAAAR